MSILVQLTSSFQSYPVVFSFIFFLKKVSFFLIINPVQNCDFYFHILNYKCALAFPVIFPCSSLLNIYLFIVPDGVLSYQLSRTENNNSIGVEDHSCVRKDCDLIVWYPMKLFFCIFGPYWTWSLFAAMLYVEFILIFNFQPLLPDLLSGSFLRRSSVPQIIFLLHFLYLAVVLYIELVGVSFVCSLFMLL